VIKHEKITKETPNRIFKGGGLVFLKEEMANPGKTIAEYWD